MTPTYRPTASHQRGPDGTGGDLGLLVVSLVLGARAPTEVGEKNRCGTWVEGVDLVGAVLFPGALLFVFNARVGTVTELL